MATRAAGERGFVEVEIRLTDGRSEVIRVDAAPGHPTQELSWEDIRHKFMDCAAHGGIASTGASRAF